MKHLNTVDAFLLLESTDYKKYWMKDKNDQCKLLCMIRELI